MEQYPVDFKLKVRSSILRKVYSDSLDNMHVRINKLVYKEATNLNLYPNKNNVFHAYYKGKVYYSIKTTANDREYFKSRQLSNIIDMSLKGMIKLQKLVIELEELTDNMNIAHIGLTSFTNDINLLTDIKETMPSALYSMVPFSVTAELPSLSGDELCIIKEEYRSIFTHIREQMVMNMLAATEIEYE